MKVLHAIFDSMQARAHYRVSLAAEQMATTRPADALAHLDAIVAIWLAAGVFEHAMQPPLSAFHSVCGNNPRECHHDT